MATLESTPSIVSLELALDFLKNEHETLLALAIALEHLLEPNDPDNLDEDHNPNAWRLSQVLHARITDTRFLKIMREFMRGTSNSDCP